MRACPVFVINLRRAPDRLQRVSTVLAGIGLPFERIEAVDGAQLDPSIYLAMTAASVRAHFLRLTPGELGCYLSHVRVLEAMVERQIPVALILEDDAEIIGNLAAQLQAVLAEGYRMPDVVKLSGTRLVGETLCILGDRSRMLRSRSAPATTVAAVWTLKGAQKFLATATPPRWPVDIALKHWWECDLLVSWLSPPSVRPSLGPSTIGRRQTTGVWSSLRRLGYRLTFAMQREWWYLTRYGVRSWLRSYGRV